MTLDLSIDLHTDGDFWIPDIDSVFDKTNVMYEGNSIVYKYCLECEQILFYLNVKGDAIKCYHAARDLMESLVCSFSVTSSHYYLVDYLYHLIIDVKDQSLYKNKSGIWTNHLFGNYDGTEIRLSIQE